LTEVDGTASETILHLSRNKQLLSCMRIMPSDIMDSPSVVYNYAKTDSEK